MTQEKGKENWREEETAGVTHTSGKGRETGRGRDTEKGKQGLRGIPTYPYSTSRACVNTHVHTHTSRDTWVTPLPAMNKYIWQERQKVDLELAVTQLSWDHFLSSLSTNTQTWFLAH